MKGTERYEKFAVDHKFRMFIENLIEALSKEAEHEKHIDLLLDAAVEFYKADRAYIIEGDFEPVCAINTHERVAKGKPYQQDTLKDLPTSAYVRWGELFLKQEVVIIEDMEAIRETLPDEYKYFMDSDVHGIIIVPFSNRLSRGLIGIDNPRRYQTDALTLRVLTHILAEQITEIKLMDENSALLGVSKIPDKMVQVKLFGQLEIIARGGKLPTKALTGKGRLLLSLMLLNPDVRFTTMEFYDLLNPGNRDFENQSVVVQNSIYKIRSKLDTIGLKELINNEDGTYFLNPEFVIDSDVQKFLQFWSDMRTENDEEERLKIAHKALGIYSNALSTSLCDSIRMETEAMDLEMKFLEISRWCAEIYNIRGEYEKAYEILHRANKINPEDGALILLMIKNRKLSRMPGLKNYAKRLRRYLTAEECNELDEIIG